MLTALVSLRWWLAHVNLHVWTCTCELALVNLHLWTCAVNLHLWTCAGDLHMLTFMCVKLHMCTCAGSPANDFHASFNYSIRRRWHRRRQSRCNPLRRSCVSKVCGGKQTWVVALRGMQCIGFLTNLECACSYIGGSNAWSELFVECGA